MCRLNSSFHAIQRCGPSFPTIELAGKATTEEAISISGDSDSDGEQSYQGGTPRSHSHKGSKKVAYVVFTGRNTGVFTEWSSAEYQVKFYPGCSFKGYYSLTEAIAAWDNAVLNNIVGVPRARPNCTVPPSTPSRQGGIPLVQPSTLSRRVLGTPIREISSTPSAQGSEARLAAIITALQDIDLVSHMPHYVVVRGEKPGVYSNSKSACTALGTNRRGLCYFVISKEAADSKYVEKSMDGKVEYL